MECNVIFASIGHAVDGGMLDASLVLYQSLLNGAGQVQEKSVRIHSVSKSTYIPKYFGYIT
jgi:hypothetical protein